MPRRHGDPAAIRVEAVVDHLRGGFGSPRDASYGLGIGLEDDVDLGRAHRIAGVSRIVAGHRLQEHALRQAHTAIFGELLGRHDLAARDASHIGNDGLHLGDAVITEKLPDLTHHVTRLSFYSAHARGWPRQKPQTARAKTDSSSPSTPGATGRRARTSAPRAP